MSEKIFLIEKGWIDPMENKNATGYKTHSYVKSEKEEMWFVGRSKLLGTWKYWNTSHFDDLGTWEY